MATRTRRPRELPPAEGEQLSRHWRAVFLGALADTSNIAAAARLAGVTPSHAYKVRRLEPDFARQWLAALCEGYDNLELELLQRLRSGSLKDDDGRKFDNAVAFRLLLAHRESAARQRAIAGNEDVVRVRESITKLETMRRRALEAGEDAGAYPDDEDKEIR